MPRRGYRKGVDDTKQPVTRSVRTHMTETEFLRLKTDASSRELTMSKLVRQVLKAHVTGKRLEVPHHNSASLELLRELARLGNNLNQLTRQANAGMVQVRAGEIQPTLDAVLSVMRKL